MAESSTLETETLDIWFDLASGVRETFFRQPADLRVHYRSGGREETAHATAIGSPLDTSAS